VTASVIVFAVIARVVMAARNIHFVRVDERVKAGIHVLELRGRVPWVIGGAGHVACLIDVNRGAQAQWVSNNRWRRAIAPDLAARVADPDHLTVVGRGGELQAKVVADAQVTPFQGGVNRASAESNGLHRDRLAIDRDLEGGGGGSDELP
jgi:hypothetical protein